MAIQTAEFEYLRSLLRETTAIALEPDKSYLVESRLAPLLVQEGFPSVQKLLETVRTLPRSGLHRKVTDALTNNETWFFRDAAPFESLRHQVLPELIARQSGQRQLTIWSAACSTGQEIYSIAMLIREYFPQLLAWDLRLVATDVSTRVLERARRGRYSHLEVNRGLPARMLAKYFVQIGPEWELSPQIRSMVNFREMNLAVPWNQVPSMDLIFLRNVLIYFDVETKREVLARIGRALRPTGYLILGCAETTLNLDDSFERVLLHGASWYRPKMRASHAAGAGLPVAMPEIEPAPFSKLPGC